MNTYNDFNELLIANGGTPNVKYLTFGVKDHNRILYNI
jgi:hypothetical protein